MNGVPATTLEGIAPALSYYSGTYTSALQLSGLTPLSAAPTEAGTYTVSARFAGSADHGAVVSLANFVITPAVATVQVVDSGGIYDGSVFVRHGHGDGRERCRPRPLSKGSRRG